jgi:hypothetical protein
MAVPVVKVVIHGLPTCQLGAMVVQLFQQQQTVLFLAAAAVQVP